MTRDYWDNCNDAELVRQFKAGRAGAFDAFVRRFQDRVFRLASVWLFDAHAAADASQEVFLRAYKGLPRFRFRSAPFTWLYRTTKYVCSEYNRKRRNEPLLHEPVDDSSNPPERQVAEADAAHRVREFVQLLPERQRDVVLLRVFEELSVADTALAMGCRPGTVKALLHKAKQNLKPLLEEDNDQPQA